MSIEDHLHNRIDLVNIPFTDRGSRIMLFQHGDSLSFRLAERWTKWENEVGHYRQRPPIIDDFRFVDEQGNTVPFTRDTQPYKASMCTSIGNFDWTFIDTETLYLRLPAGRYQLVFEVRGDRGQIDSRGGTFHGKRSVAYTTNAHIVQNSIKQLDNGNFQTTLALNAADGNALVLNITPRLGYQRSIPQAEAVFEQSQSRWQKWFEAVPPVLEAYQEQYYYAWWIMRAGLLSTRFFFTREALAPSKVHYVGVWQWDQFFHAIAYRHVDSQLAEDQLRIMLDHQQEDGMLPDAIHDEGLIVHLTKPVDAAVTKPPLIAWTVLKLYEKSRHMDFLYEVYESLVRWHEWWMRDNINACGLCEYRHPFSSGLDDSPLWDDGVPVVAPDLNTYLCVQCESLAKIATIIGNEKDAEFYTERAEFWAAQMQRVMWNEQKGIFDALYQEKPIDVFTPFQLLPMWTGRMPQRINERLIAHLTDPAHFWTKWPIPSVSASDPKFNPEQMWRGPTWPNINFLFVEALERIGQTELAQQLRTKTLDLIMQHRDIYEYYNPITGTRPVKSAPIFGWSSAVFIDLAIQETAYVQQRQQQSVAT
ncbi:MAG: hypothetical protein KF716_32020 [Anaerolineae bacterium]|nr:hypothetical protein [Anaerolineae bacterium]